MHLYVVPATNLSCFGLGEPGGPHSVQRGRCRGGEGEPPLGRVAKHGSGRESIRQRIVRMRESVHHGVREVHQSEDRNQEMDDQQRMRVTSRSRPLLEGVTNFATHTSTKRFIGWGLRSLGHIGNEQEGAATMRWSEKQEEPLRCGEVIHRRAATLPDEMA